MQGVMSAHQILLPKQSITCELPRPPTLYRYLQPRLPAASRHVAGIKSLYSPYCPTAYVGKARMPNKSPCQTPPNSSSIAKDFLLQAQAWLFYSIGYQVCVVDCLYQVQHV